MSPDALRDLVAFQEEETAFWLLLRVLGLCLLTIPVAFLAMAVKVWWEKQRKVS